jgi:lantibiotic biosynthesis protein
MDALPAPAMQATNRKARPRQRALYEALSWVLARAPLLPADTYRALSASPGSLASLLNDPAVRTAIAVGSGSLLDALDRTGSGGQDDPWGKLLRYIIRMSTRPTPYGLFAGVALATWGSTTTLSLQPGRPRTRTRPDMAWLLSLALEAESRPEVRSGLRYIANARAYVRAGRVFLPEAAPSSGTAGAGATVSIRATRAVREVLTLARDAVSHADVVAAVASSTGGPADKVENLIDDLWRQTLLLTDLRPPLTAGSPAHYVRDRLRTIPAASDVVERLDSALASMAVWDALPIEEAAAAHRRLAIDPAVGEEQASTTPCQIDMALTLRGSQVAQAVALEAASAAELLLRVTPFPIGLPHLDGYRRAFEARYGNDREVPLLEMLDTNFGLGPPSGFHGGAPRGDARKIATRNQRLYELGINALREHELTLDLTDKDLEALETWPLEPAAAPRSLDLSLFVIAGSAADVDRGHFRIVVGPNLGATAAGRNLGRFADLLGAPAARALDELEAAESVLDGDRLRVELVYLPRRFRSGNVVLRPHRQPYEIVVGTTPGRPADQVIPLDELVVGVRNDRFYVRWTAVDQEIIACAGHMLNNMQAPDACRFLDDIRREGQPQFNSFDWGSASGLPVLPRVQVGRIILSLAQWRIDARLRDALAIADPVTFASALRDWRAGWKVPRYVYLSFGDNRLLLDLEDRAQAEELRNELRRLPEPGQLFLHEALPGPEDAWVPGPDGHFVTELVVPLVLRPRVKSDKTQAPRPQVIPVAETDRLQLPGSDWLFAKLYGPRAFQDDLLTGAVLDFCRTVTTCGPADSWFFIRYSDPDPHVRLRFHGVPMRLLEDLVPRLCAWAVDLVGDGLLTRLCFDTYEREVERFGGPTGVALSEAVFHADSVAAVEMLRLSSAGLLGLDMGSLAMLSIDDLLAALGLHEADRVTWYRERVSSRTLAGEEYRRRKTELRRLLGDAEQLWERPGGDALSRVLAERRNKLAPLARQLDSLASAGALSQAKSTLLRSYVHLHCNRLLGGGRLDEETILALLSRTRYGLSQAPYVPPALA